jgi:hypothetical protein
MREVYEQRKSYADTGLVSGQYIPEISRPVLARFSTSTNSNKLRFEIRNSGEKRRHVDVRNFDVLYEREETGVLKWKNVQENVIGKTKKLDSLLSEFDGPNGPARPVLGLLFPNEINAPKLTEIEHPKIISKRALVGKRKCFEICGDLGGNSVTLWIDKSSYLVRKVETSHEFEHKLDHHAGHVDSSDKTVFKTTVIYKPILNHRISDSVFDWKQKPQ